MVAVGDFGIQEREKMVRVAIRHGWIDWAEQAARTFGVGDPVVVLIAIDALGVWNFKFNRPPRVPSMEAKQRKARCKRFTVAVVSYSDLLLANDADRWREDLQELCGKGGVSVVCINRTGQFLASVSQ